ncbi:MAG TPA: hypothetical protein VFC12_09020 [Terriglobales bacterium]|jgi:hypothetical protein|nr:hypothetical protein [Terriglobales bacterium]
MTYVAISIGAVPWANARYLLGGWLSGPLGIIDRSDLLRATQAVFHTPTATGPAGEDE